MKNNNKNSLIIFGYSEILTLGLVVNSKLDKVKNFNIFDYSNEDKFFKVISSFFSNKLCLNYVYYSCGPGGFTIIRQIISYVKALNFKNFSKTKFIGLNNLFIIAYHLNHKYKINGNRYILSILNHSKDNFVQIYKKKKNSNFFLHYVSDVKNMELDFLETYIKNLNLSIQNLYSVYLGSSPNSVLFLSNVHIVDRSNILETIFEISTLIENNKINQNKYKYLFLANFSPLYGKLPSTN